MSVEAVSWAINKAPVGGNTTARMVLVSLADKADERGRDAWKYASAIADSIRKSDATVRRALKDLEKIGVIERGDQHLVDHYPEYLRPTVYNLRLSLVQEPTERQKRKGRVGRSRKQVKNPETRPEPDEKTLSQNERGFSETTNEARHEAETTGPDIATASTVSENHLSLATDGLTESPSHRYEEVLEPEITSHQCEGPSLTGEIHNVQIHNPSAPTGHLPASGETPAAETESETTDMGREWERAGTELADRFDLMRSKLGLPSAVRERRDETAMCRLVRQVARSNGDDDPAKTLLTIGAVIDWMPANRYWLSRTVRCRDFAKHWTGIANDCAVDRLTASQRHDAEARDRDKPENRPVHRHTWKCEHVLALLGRDEMTADPDELAMRTVSQLNAGKISANVRAV